jgi:hypothetical protein
MARVVYTAVHENRAFPTGDDRRGHGRDHATWVFSEEPGLEEGLFRGGLELMIDARLEPGAAIGSTGTRPPRRSTTCSRVSSR